MYEPYFVFWDILGASGSELRQQRKKLVRKGDFPRPTRRERNLRSICEGEGVGGEGSVWQIQDYRKLRTPPSGQNAALGGARL